MYIFRYYDINNLVIRVTTFADPRIALRQQLELVAEAVEAKLPRYKRNLRRKMLCLQDMFRHEFRARVEYATNQITIQVSRNNVFEASYITLMNTKPDRLHDKLNIIFIGEEALDYGGVSREWYVL